MSGGSTQQAPGAAGGAATPGPFSWSPHPATTPSTFDPKTFGTDLFSNLDTAFKQGPQSLIPSYNPFTPQTSGLINSGLQQVSDFAGGPLKDFASGKYLDGSNDPYFNANLKTARDNTTQDVNSSFSSMGRFGSDIHAQGLATGLDQAENQAREAQLQNEWSQMLGAQTQLTGNTATGLGYSNLLDSKNAEKIASDREQQQSQDPYAYIAKYLGLLNSGTNAQNVNQPTSLWDILGALGSTALKVI